MREHATPVPHLFFFFFICLAFIPFWNDENKNFSKKKERTIVSHFFFLQNQNPQNTFQYDRRKNNISTRFKLNVPKYQVWIFITRLYKTIPLLVYILVLNLDIYIYTHIYIYTIHTFMHRYTIKTQVYVWHAHVHLHLFTHTHPYMIIP